MKEAPPRRRLRPVALSVLSLWLSVGTLSCASPKGTVDVEVLELQHRLDSPTDAVVEPAVVRRNGDAVTAQWWVKSPRAPAAYIDWSAKRIGGDYQVTNRTDSSIAFTKQTEGDAFYLKVEAVQTGGGVLVQFTLNAMPD